MSSIPVIRLAVAVTISLVAAVGLADTRDAERMQQLEQKVAALEQELDALRAEGRTPEDRLTELERKVGILAEEVADLRVGEAAVTADTSVTGLGPAASKVYRTDHGVSIGGYGEWLYEGFSDTRDDGEPWGKNDVWDALRAVMYLGYKFNDRFVLNSEIEYEHATTGGSGEVSLEFAYIDYLHSRGLGVRAGLVLMPMGFINELHEPTTFLGAKRPETERRIIPTTWRENGLGLFGEVGPLSYRTYIVNGLDAEGFSAAGLRGGRQKGSKAKADDLAWVGRLDYEGIPGLGLGMSAYIGNSGQNLMSVDGSTLDVRTAIWEAHAEWRVRGLEARALYARSDLDDVAELNAALGLTGPASIGESLEGFYLQVGYDVLAAGSSARSLTPFIRWEQLNTQQSVPLGFAANPAYDEEILTLGLSFKPIEQLVIKADYQNTDNAGDTGVDQLNIALGYIF